MNITSKSLPRLHGLFALSLDSTRPETRGTYERALRGFVTWASKDRRFRFRVEDVERYKKYLVQEKRLAKASVSTYLTALRRFCEYLVDQGTLKTNPARSVGGSKRPVSHSRGSLSPQEAVALLAVIPGDDEMGARDRAIARLMLDCGLSEIEIVRLNIGDRKSGNGVLSLAVQGKGRSRKDEQVIVPAGTDEAIQHYLTFRKRATAGSPMFLSVGNRIHGKRMSTRAVRDRINFYLSRAGIRRIRSRRITPFSLRHTAARMMADAGAPADEIRSRMRLGSNATAMWYMGKTTR